jgi:hypothetical protein
MSLTGRIPSGSVAAGLVPELYSKKVLDAIHTALIIVPVVDHQWEPELTAGDKMSVGILNTVEATEVTIGTEGVVKDIATGAKKQITIDKYYEAPVVIGDMTKTQSQINLLEKAQRESGYAIAKKIDSSLAALFSALNGGTSKGTDGHAITDDVLIDCVELLDEADVPRENRVWIFDPSSRADIMKIDKFVRSDYGYGDEIPTGAFRKDVYGAPLLITNNLTVNSTGNYGVYMHKEALAIIAQEKSKVDVVPQPLKHQTTVNTTALWGVAEMRDSFGVPVCTRKS